MRESIGLILALLFEFSKCFSRKISFRRFVGYVLVSILSYNRKTITGIYRFLGCDDNLSNYHRFLMRSPWDPERIAEILFKLLLKYIYVLQSAADRLVLIILVDSTVIAKSGTKTEGLDKYYSSTLEKQQKGNEVVRLSLVFNLPDIGIVEFPFMCRLYVTEKSIERFGLPMEYLTREVIGARMIQKVRTWTELPILLIGDALYSTETTINPIMEMSDVNLISRRRNGEKNSGVCWETVKMSETKGRGRPRKRGREIRFNDIPAEDFVPCKYVKRGEERTVGVKRFDNVTIRRCASPITIVVILENNGGRYVLLSSDGSLETSRIIELYRLRFQIEFGFRDTKQYLGFGDYQVRKSVSILKHLTISQTAYSLCKMLYVLNDGFRKRCNAIFYMGDKGKKQSFSMMTIKEELRDDFFAWILGRDEKKKLNYLALIFHDKGHFGGNFKKGPPNNGKQADTTA